MSKSSVNGIPLAGNAFSSGAAFEIDKPALEDLDLTYDGGWSLQLRAKESVLVVRGSDLRDFRPVLNATPAAASRGLDLVCVRGGPAYALSKASEEGIYFWPTGKSLGIRWHSTLLFGITGLARLTVGSETDSPPHAINHHPSFTHFRRSQIETDLGDSYRHAYLALESLLDSLRPQATGESEGAWLMAALTAANSVVAGGQALPEDTAERQHREWYDDERNHLFHSKSSSRIVREPALTGYAYAKLVRKKNALLTFYISLLQARLGFPNISGGGLTYAGFEAILERYELGTFTAHTEDDAEPAHSSSSAALLRELHGEPNGEGYYKCREVPVPTTRRVQRWLSEIDGQPATWSDLGGAVLELDDRDTLSISLHLMNGVTSFKKHFLT